MILAWQRKIITKKTIIIKAIKILTALIILKWKIQITTMKDNTLKNSGIPKTGNFLSSLIFKPQIFLKI